ncbi:endospore germination permease [Brevibacillus formosus]|uniref:GerAB/ArcD/ProY family transporter n=1 Tax=Brevibacillus TaxID=55080 RepID=UPI000D113FF2|nr:MULTISPECIES: endospore germination permease [Brevibacillus]MBG9945028.1 spore gernimation protein [Brevibacillus formosus]MED1947550.1 endospore germination permease [Brevibacillus formosus]MED1997183.1 endospore germination permease [Brevibacillus formosus]MED2083040.1 endospore germination permease [Brevibacillus formosus]PSK20075.1 spore gernimation protein [Brevibacillus sp. NRRL NRS-603]
MIHKQVVNHRQIAWLVGSVLMTGMMIGFLRSVVQVARMDGWFSQIFPIFYALFIAYVLSKLVEAYPGKNIFEILFIIGGKWIGGAVNLLILFYIWIILAIDIKGAADFLHISLLPNTPLEVVLLVFVLLMMYYGKTSLEVAARVNEFYFPLYFIMCISLYFLLMNEYNVERLEPILTNRLDRIVISNFFPVGVYGDIFLIGAFLHAIVEPRLFYAAMKHGVIIVGFGTTIMLLVLLGVMGYIIAGRLNFPIYILVQQIHITDFLDRVEMILFSVWFPAFTIKVIVAYLAFLVGVGSFGGQRHYNTLNAPCGWFIVVSSIFAFPNIAHIDQFISYSLPMIVLSFQLPLALFLLVHVSRKNKGREQSLIPEGTKLYRFYRSMVWTTTVCLSGCVIVILIGDFFKDKSALGGGATAVTYIILLLIALLTSYGEMQALNHGKQKLGKAKQAGSFRQ